MIKKTQKHGILFYKKFTLSTLWIFIVIWIVMGIWTDRAYAIDTTLQPDSDGNIYIDSSRSVGPGDTLNIPAGTTVEFRNNSYIYVRGRMNIGLDSIQGTSSGTGTETGIDTETNPLKGTRVISNGTMTPIQVGGGTLTVFNVNFTGGKFFAAYQGAHAFVSSSTFETEKDSSIIYVYQSSGLEMSSSVMKNSFPPGQSIDNGYVNFSMLEVYSSSTATMTNMIFDSPKSSHAVAIYNNSNLKIDDSIFSNCEIGITVFKYSKVKGVGNEFNCRSHPYTIYSTSTVEFLAKPKECCSQVIFVPGLQGSRLYKRGIGFLFENQLWEPNNISDVKKLFLDEEGKSILSGIYTRDIIEKINIAGSYDKKILNVLSPSIYSKFISYLKKLKTDKVIEGYTTFPYDWRFTPAEVSAESLVANIEKQAALASDEKIILISHSYGGFVVKKALELLQLRGKENLIRSVIYVAFPETGAPQAIFSSLHGDKTAILGGIIMDAVTAIGLGANMPSAHFLTPSAYFSKIIDLEFLNKKTGETTKYANTTQATDRYSLTKIHTWLKQKIQTADRNVGQQKDSPSLKKFSVTPSPDVGNRTNFEKEDLYQFSAVLEDSFRSYSIVGIDMPTPIGMLYRYIPCFPFPIKIIAISGTCINLSSLDRVTRYSRHGDGTVVFDGHDRRTGTDTVISLASSNVKNKTSINHADIMESVDVQKVITSMIKATSSPASDPFSDGLSGTGFNSTNPWINTDRVFGLDITGFIEGNIQISASSSSIATLDIITLDQREKIQTITGAPEALAVTNVTNTSDGWSFGSAGSYARMTVRSLADQSISMIFSEHTEENSDNSSTSTTGGTVNTVITESFTNVEVGYGSILSIDTQYVTPTPSHILTLDIDADGVGDINIAPDSPDQNIVGDTSPVSGGGSGSGSGSGSATSSTASSTSTSSPTTPLSFSEKKVLALESIIDAKISISQLEIYALIQINTSMLNQAERYVKAENPTFALLTIKKKQARLAELSTQYAIRLHRLENNLLTFISSGFRSPKERLKREAEISKIKAYIRDLARLKLILKEVESRAIDLLI